MGADSSRMPAPPDGALSPDDAPDRGGSRPGERLARGVCRMLGALGYGILTEFRLPSGRRADVMALGPGGDLAIVEVKSSPADYLSDRKWQDYLAYCDSFFFAVPAGFPMELLPDDCGLIVADDFDGVLLRPSPVLRVAPSRRRAQILRFALVASRRLHRLDDSGL
jgi:hypothetical protein